MCEHLGATAKLRTSSAAGDCVNCNCNWKLTDAMDYERKMLEASYDVCFIEAPKFLPVRSTKLVSVLNTWKGSTATMLREPWGRYKSSYDRDFSQIGRANYSIEEFRQDICGNGLYGHYNKPNFYVRMLAGLANDPVAEATQTDLQNAIQVLRALDHVFILEKIDEGDMLAQFSGTPEHFPHKSNNPYSVWLEDTSDHLPEPPNSDHYEATYYNENALDVALYNEAVRIHAERAAAGRS